MNIKVIGSGCDKCDKVYALVQEAVEELALEAEIEKVEDLIGFIFVEDKFFCSKCFHRFVDGRRNLCGTLSYPINKILKLFVMDLHKREPLSKLIKLIAECFYCKCSSFESSSNEYTFFYDFHLVPP